MTTIYNPIWKKLGDAWSKIIPPWRPSKEEIIFWEKEIVRLKKNNSKLKVLVTGSTPEIREMLGRHNINTTLLDASPNMYRAMSRCLKNKNKKEKIIFGSWLEAKNIFSNNYFDAVIGDEPHCNVAFKDWPAFFENFYLVLKPNSYFFLSTVVSDLSRHLTIKDVLKKYKKEPKFFEKLENKIWLYYQLFNNPGIFDQKKKEFKMHRLREILVSEGRKSGLKTSDLKKLWFFEDDLKGELFGTNLIEVDPSFKEQRKIQGTFFVLDKVFKKKRHPAFNIRRTMILRSRKKIVS